MQYYAVGALEVTDAAWVPTYVEQVTPIVERYGGRYLARTGNAEVIEGERGPRRMAVIIDWPSREGALAFYQSPEYAPHRTRRLAGATGAFLLVAGEDMAAATTTTATQH